MLKRLSAVVVSVVFSLWALMTFAQQVKPGAVKKWNPAASKTGKKTMKSGSGEETQEPPCVDGDDCVKKYGVETAEEAMKVIELNEERVIKKRVGPGPVA